MNMRLWQYHWNGLSFQVFSSSQWKPHWTGETINTERHRVPGVMFVTQARLYRGASLEGATSHRPACSSDPSRGHRFAQRAAEQWGKEQCCQRYLVCNLGYECPLLRNVGKVFPMCLFPFWFSWEYYFRTKNTSFKLYPERLLLALELRHTCWTAKMTL